MTRLHLLLVSLAFVLVGCLFDDFDDGRKCSTANTCPPGQVCSVDGECLAPCPEPGCVGASCGCDRVMPEDTDRSRVCLADGLCHVTCTANPSMCNGKCDVAAGICRPECTSGGCANDAGCVAIEMGSICKGAWPDGGTGPDAATCTDCGEECVDLQTSSNHCGACDHGCAGGDCVDGQCLPLVIGTLPTASYLTTALDAQSLFVASSHDLEGVVYRCGREGCTAPVEIVSDATQTGFVSHLAATGSRVYWIEARDGERRLVGCPSSGCGGQPDLLTEGNLVDLAANGNHVYFADANFGGGVRRCAVPVCAGGPEEVWTEGQGRLVLLDTESVYLVEDSTSMPGESRVLACGLDGCGATPREVTTETGLVELAQDADHLYLHLYDESSQGHQLRVCPKNGGPSDLLREFQDGARNFVWPAASALGVFWVEANGVLGWWDGCADCPRRLTDTAALTLQADADYLFLADQGGGISRLVPR